jgi:hypothetical protein
MVNKQLILRPQDLVVVIKLRLLESLPFTYVSLSAALGMSASEIHSSIRRAQVARLVTTSESGQVEPIRVSLVEFVAHGVRYAFPPVLGPTTRGMPTAFGVEPLRSAFAHAEEAPVWPLPRGATRGPSLQPLYPSVPAAAEKDATLYEILAAIDGIRIGAARERELAQKVISERLL